MKVHELYKLLGDAIAAGYRDCDVVIHQDETSLNIVDTSWYDLGPGMFQIEVE